MTITKTYPPMVAAVYKALGSNQVVRHEVTATNQIGQSGVHTFCDDVIQIVFSSRDFPEAYKNLILWLSGDSI
jgi:hypothetical protein